MKKIIGMFLVCISLITSINAKEPAVGKLIFESNKKNNVLKNITDEHIDKRNFFKKEGLFIDCLDKEIGSEIRVNGVSYLVVNDLTIRTNLDRAETLCTSNVTNMRSLFKYQKHFNSDISKWDVSNVTDMSFLFYGAKTFNQPLNNWLVFNVNNMNSMFSEASSFNQNISSWDVSNVERTDEMFKNATSFNQPLNNWNTRRLMATSYMFYGASSFNQPLNNWNTTNIVYMGAMFKYAEKFKQDLTNWDVSNVIEHEQFVFTEEMNLPKFKNKQEV